MTTAPAWSPVDHDTADLLALLAEQHPAIPSIEDEWQHFVSCLHDVGEAHAAEGFLIPPNVLRPLVRDHVKPQRIGAFTNRAVAEGLIEATGDWQISDDHHGRNSGRPARVYRLRT